MVFSFFAQALVIPAKHLQALALDESPTGTTARAVQLETPESSPFLALEFFGSVAANHWSPVAAV
jgi:hypothetical protein